MEPTVCTHDTDTHSLDALGLGRRGRVRSVGGDPDVRRRLLEMGMCTGVRVEVVRRAPFGDPIELKVRGYALSLRAEQAALVVVSPER
jgi:Fe2+ transport system protein FeoA